MAFLYCSSSLDICARIFASKWASESALRLFGKEILKIMPYKIVQQVAYCSTRLFFCFSKFFVISFAQKHA
jgi:hypothetical protein